MTASSKPGRASRKGLPSAPAGRPAGPPVQGGSGDAANTRVTLMEILKRAGETDVASLSRQLGISGVAVRQHLAALERDGKIAQRSVRRPVGRPAKLYRLTEAADHSFPQASAKVALDLLAQLERMKGPEAIEKLLQARLRDLLKRYQERLKGVKSWSKKLRILAEIREAEGYFCDSEPAPPSEAKGGLRLVEHHCPLSDLARQHPAVCRYELELFKRLLNEPDLRRIDHLGSGGHACVYESPGRADSGGAAPGSTTRLEG
jgi:predicted ArsR family transcriptional regulator